MLYMPTHIPYLLCALGPSQAEVGFIQLKYSTANILENPHRPRINTVAQLEVTFDSFIQPSSTQPVFSTIRHRQPRVDSGGSSIFPRLHGYH